MDRMEKVVRVFKSFEEAERADREYYRSLTPQQRLDILLELVERGNRDAPQRFERVCRVTQLEQR